MSADFSQVPTLSANPAADLLVIIRMWQETEPAAAGIHGRGIASGPNDEGGKWIRAAMTSLARIEDALPALEAHGVNVGVYRGQLNTWMGMIISYPNGWITPNGNDSSFNDRATDNLESLANFIQIYSPKILTAGREVLVDVVRAARDLLLEDDGLPDELRGYVFRLLAELDTALAEHSSLGRFDLDDALNRLWLSLYAAAGATTNTEKQGLWRRLAENLGYPIAAGLIANGPQLALSIAQATGHG